jgi:hypothetical protein
VLASAGFLGDACTNDNTSFLSAGMTSSGQELKNICGKKPSTCVLKYQINFKNLRILPLVHKKKTPLLRKTMLTRAFMINGGSDYCPDRS